MPKAIHDALAKAAASKGLTGDRRNAYIYVTLYNIEHGSTKHKMAQALAGKGKR